MPSPSSKPQSSTSVSRVLFPRYQLFEIADQSWCPAWVREHSHAMLSHLWSASNTRAGSPAVQASELLLRAVGGPAEASKYTFVDGCAGAGGPTPFMAHAMNQKIAAAADAATEKLRVAGGKGRVEYTPAKFVLTDMWPDVEAWKKINAKDGNVRYIEEATDATRPRRLALEGTKECRVFNLCFHHFDDESGKKVLASAVKSTDAFMIFEITHRTLPSLLNVALVVLGSFFVTLLDFWWSPLHLIFTYLIPLIPISFAIDGWVSCARGRSAEETWDLLYAQPDLDLSEWELQSGEQTVLFPFARFYWYSGVKRGAKSI